MREVEADGEPFCYVVGLDAPEGGECGHTLVEMRARDHIRTKVRSFQHPQGGRGKCASLRIYSLDMNTDVKNLFGDIVAEQTEKGTYLVREKNRLVSPYEYAAVRQLTPKCWALRRANDVLEDILFANSGFGNVLFHGAYYAYVLDSWGGEDDKTLIAAVCTRGIYVYDERGIHLATIPDHYVLVVLDGEFLVSFASGRSDLEAKVYDLKGHLLAQGPVENVFLKAHRISAMRKWRA